jgi:hypothetical protein
VAILIPPWHTWTVVLLLLAILIPPWHAWTVVLLLLVCAVVLAFLALRPASTVAGMAAQILVLALGLW